MVCNGPHASFVANAVQLLHSITLTCRNQQNRQSTNGVACMCGSTLTLTRAVCNSIAGSSIREHCTVNPPAALHVATCHLLPIHVSSWQLGSTVLVMCEITEECITGHATRFAVEEAGSA